MTKKKVTKKKDNDMEMTRTHLIGIINKRYKPSFSQRLGNFFETLLSFIVIIALLLLVIFIIVMLIENPLSLLILFVGIALIILIRRNK